MDLLQSPRPPRDRRLSAVTRWLLAICALLSAAALIVHSCVRIHTVVKERILARGERFYRLEAPGNAGAYRGRIVRAAGVSMEHAIRHKTPYLLLEDYYERNDIRRFDVVVLEIHGYKGFPLVKAVYGVPGDRWRLAEVGDRWRIILNDEPLRNSEGQEFLIPKAGAGALSQAASGHPVIPEHRYLVLGTQPEGTLDSTRLGLFSRTDIAGRLVKQP